MVQDGDKGGQRVYLPDKNDYISQKSLDGNHDHDDHDDVLFCYDSNVKDG